MNVLTVVVAHAARTHHLESLLERTEASQVFLDDGSLGEWANHERALRWAAATAARRNLSHVCVVQDDALPVDGFVSHLEALAVLRPDDMIGLYVGTHRPHREAVDIATEEADDLGAMFLSYRELSWGVATLMPAAAIEPMLEAVRQSNRPYDIRLGRGWKAVTDGKKPVLYTWPALVDHRDERPVVPRSLPQGVRVARRVGPLTGDPQKVVPILTDEPIRRRREARERNGKKPSI